eukprot:5561071-Amphidinium_carterae.1
MNDTASRVSWNLLSKACAKRKSRDNSTSVLPRAVAFASHASFFHESKTSWEVLKCIGYQT